MTRDVARSAGVMVTDADIAAGKRDDGNIMSAKPKPAVVEDDPALVVTLAARLVEQAEDIRRLRIEFDDMRRQLGIRSPSPPPGWISIKQAVHVLGDNISQETIRLWCINNRIRADRFAGTWFVDPRTLPAPRLESHA
jgi:hypothetical protein